MGNQRRKTKHKKWTPEEDELLKKLYQKYTKADIAKRLERTPSSITNRKNVLGIDSFMDVTDRWNFKQISEAVGRSKTAIRKSWVPNGLKFVKRGCYCLVEEKEVLRFMQEHPNLWDATKCDYYLFYQYPWFLKKLEEDRKKPANAKKYFWTDYEKSILVTLKKRGLSHKEIAKRLGRTKKAIDGMVSLMGLTKKAV